MISVKNNKIVLFALLSASMFAQAATNNPIVGAVFTPTNAAPFDDQGNPQFNGVMMYHRHADGTLTLVPGSPFLTEGQGAGGAYFPPTDPLGSVNSIIVDEKNKYLFVVDAGSDQVSVFRIHHNKLTHIETVSSGGTFPNSLAVRNNMLYVLNSGGTTNIMAFKVCKNGRLKGLKRCNLQPPLNVWPIVPDGLGLTTAIPSEIGFSPNGRFLLVVRKEGFLCSNPAFPACLANVAGPGRIDVYALDKKSRVIDCANPTANINMRSPAGRMPFPFIFSENGQLLVGEFLGTAGSAITPFGTSAMSSYNLKSDGVLEVISADVGNGQSGLCWAVRSGNYVYTSNFLSATISLYSVDKNGNLTLLDPVAANLNVLNPSASSVIDSAVTSDGRFLYQLTDSNGLIYAFEINKMDGSLTFIGTVSSGSEPTNQGIVTADFRC